MFRIYNNHYLHSSIFKLFTYNCSLYTFRLNRTFLIPKIRFDHDKFSNSLQRRIFMEFFKYNHIIFDEFEYFLQYILKHAFK